MLDPRFKGHVFIDHEKLNLNVSKLVSQAEKIEPDKELDLAETENQNDNSVSIYLSIFNLYYCKKLLNTLDT